MYIFLLLGVLGGDWWNSHEGFLVMLIVKQILMADASQLGHSIGFDKFWNIQDFEVVHFAYKMP
jgi:hypothetical protein